MPRMDAMQLNDTQKDAVRKWIAEGCGLTEIQKRLNDEFKLTVTFLDLRFLVLDLGLTIKVQAKNTSAVLDLAKASGLARSNPALVFFACSLMVRPRSR